MVGVDPNLKGCFISPRPVCSKQFLYILLAGVYSPVKRCRAIVGLGINVSSIGNKQLYNFDIAGCSGPMQRTASIVCLSIYVCALIYQLSNNIGEPAFGFGAVGLNLQIMVNRFVELALRSHKDKTEPIAKLRKPIF